MGRLGGFKYREVTRKLTALGFSFSREAPGSHEVWRNPVANRSVIVARHTKNMPEGTLRSILRQAGIDVEEFLKA